MPIDKVLNHIRLDDSGIAWIDDTRVKVIGVAMKHLAHGWSSEEINRQHPTLSLAQVYAALSFYYDHQSEFDDAIFESAAEAEQLAAGKTGFTWSPQIARDGTSALCEPHHEFDTFCGRHLSVFPSRTLSVFARGDL